MKTYRTMQGDMWDAVAYTQMGSTGMTDRLMQANPDHLGTYIFPAGVTLVIPEADDELVHMVRPPWKDVAG